MRVLVIGGTRYFGKSIVRRFLDRGDDVTVLSRGNSRPDFWDDVDHVAVDRGDRAAMAYALRGNRFDLVIDNIAFEKSEVETVVDLFRGRIGRYVVTSSISVYGDIGHAEKPWQETTAENRHLHYFTQPEAPHPLVEDSVDLSMVPWHLRPGINPYSENKRQVERFLSETTNFPCVVLRAPIVIGPGEYAGRFWWYLQRVLDQKGIVLRNGGQVRIRLGFCDDIAKAIVDAALSDRTVGGTYNIGQDEVLTLREFVDLIANACGVESRLADVTTEDAEKVTSIPWDDWRYEPFSWPPRFAMSIDQAKSDFGLENAPVEQRINETIEWHLATKLGDSFGYEQRSAETGLFEANKG